jgi:hypothetical protein
MTDLRSLLYLKVKRLARTNRRELSGLMAYLGGGSLGLDDVAGAGVLDSFTEVSWC